MLLFATCLLVAALSGCASKKTVPAKVQPVPKVQPVQTDVYYDVAGRRWLTLDGRPCSRCTAQNGYASPKVMDEDMYYDPAIRKWRQSSMKGAVCHTCTPQYGYPIPPK
jgi:hypothetical protein